ncbi:glycosyl hydrolase family 28-related protein [uncultured Ruminococcus sp.]|uniref:glycosyl hydrolase family 28-related protein n=1 Tax=uncultured Ruminococcus sp. TaxID=165186 RepID=UPI0025CD7834|nr:glycosyl hydrolase family 28-related protein [uncultured Ruminococcus sp.]
MNVITYDVYKNTVKKHDGFNPVTSEKNYTKLQFRFQKGDDWEKCTLVTASFWLSNDNIVKSDVELLSDNLTATFDIPPEFSGVKGTLKVGLQGTYFDENENAVTVSTNIITLNRNTGVIITEGANAELYEKAISLVQQYFNEIKANILSEEVNLLNITGISDSSNDYFIKTIKNNTVTVTSKEGDKSVNMLLTLDNGRITCKGTTGNRALTIKLSADFERNGEYLFALQNQQTLALGYPRICIGKQTSDYLIYGVNKTSYKSVNLSSEAYKTVFVAFPNNSSFDISFNLSLTRSVNIKPYLPYNVNPKLFVNRADYYNDTVYPHMFGAVGDGVTDDTAALQLAVDYAVANKKLLKLSGGCTYLISNTLKWYGAYIRFDGNNATIKVSDLITPFTAEALSSVFEINNIADLEDNTHSRYILRRFGNVNIDCNCGRAVYGIYAERGGKTVYQNIMVNNPEFCALRMIGAEAVICNVHACQTDVNYDDIRNDYKNSAGIYLSASDSYVENCVCVDFVRGFATGGTDNHFSKCHAWNAIDMNKMKNSISFDVLGGYSTFSQCTVDSTKYGFYLHKQNYETPTESARVCVIGGVSAYNSVYVKNYDELGEPTLFWFSDEHTLKGKAVIIVSSNFKATAGINCNFDNLTDDDGKIYMDRLMPHYENNNEVFWQNAHCYDFNGINDLLSEKYDSSNVEAGSGTLTPYTTSADIVKSADFTYQRVGRVVTVNVNIVFNAGTKSQVTFTNLPYVCKNTVNPRELCVSNTKVTRIWAINKNNTMLNIISEGSSASYKDGETLAFTLSYLVS